MAYLPIPDFPALLDELDRRGITVELDGDRLILDAPAGAMVPEIAMQVRRYRDLLVAGIVGRRTGHVWAPCDVCGQVVLLNPAPRLDGKHVWPTCYLTPGCTGRHTTETRGKESNAA